MNFRGWVKSIGGAPALSKLLNVSRHRVNSWLRGEATPHYDIMCKIVKASKNKITIEKIVVGTKERK